MNAILVDNGMSEKNADTIARNCVSAERDGALSHGLFRIPGYVSTLRSGYVDGKAVPILHDAAASVIQVDAANGFAQVALDAARPLAIEKARQTGACVVAIKDSHHFAALWPDVEPFAREGFVALACANSLSRVVPWGGKRAIYGTNPLALAVPAANGEEPLVFDQASSTIAHGEVLLAARAGKHVPAATGVDKHGKPTDDPQTILDGGALLPFGGYKGSSIAMMVELFAAALTGAPFSFEVDLSGHPGAQTSRTGELVLVIDPDKTAGKGFAARVSALIAQLRECGQERIPGDKRYARRKRALVDGIAVDESTLQRLHELRRST